MSDITEHGEVPEEQGPLPLNHLAQVAHAAIQKYQQLTGDRVWSPWEDCADGLQQEQVALMADLMDDPDLAEGTRYGELRVAIIQALG